MGTRDNVTTLPLSARKRAANRVRRLRGSMSREAFVVLLRARGVDVCERTLGDIERGRVRMTALEIVEALSQESQYRNGEAERNVTAEPLIRSDRSVLPAARSCGARASGCGVATPGTRVVRSTAGTIPGKAA